MKKIILSALAIASFTITTNAQLDRSVQPKPGKSTTIKLGKSKSFELENGLKVILVENHKFPTFSAQLFIDRDPLLEGDKAGLLSIYGDVWRNGTLTKTKAEIDEYVDFLGAGVGTGSASISASGLKKNVDSITTLLTEILYTPAFSQNEFDKTTNQMMSGLQAQKTNADAIAGNVRSVVLYGKNHPYADITTEETIENIELNDLRNYYNTYFAPNIAYLIIVGDFKLGEAKKYANKYFGNWKRKDVPTFTYEKPNKNEGNQVYFVNKPGSVQSIINVTYTVNLTPTSQDVLAANVMNNILGGGISGRLSQNIREDKGYTYGAYSSLSSDDLEGAASFNASASVRNSVTDSAITEFIFEINRMRTEKVSEELLEMTKKSMAGSFARALENDGTIASFAYRQDLYNLPENYYATYLERLEAITIDDVYKAAQKYLTTENLNIVIVGDREEVAGSLKQFSSNGEIIFLDMYGDIAKDDVIAAPVGLTATQVYTQSLLATFNVKDLNEVKEIEAKTTSSYIKYTMEVSGMQMIDEVFMKGNKISKSMTMNGQLFQKEWFDGTKGYYSGARGDGELVNEQIESLKNATGKLDLNFITDENKLIGITYFNNKKCYKIEKNTEQGKSFIYFDIETGLKAGEEQFMEMNGQSMTITSYINNYKLIDGKLYASEEVMEAGPQVIKRTLDTVEINLDINEDVFKK